MIPAHDEAPRLERNIELLVDCLNQWLTLPYEVIIVEDGSTDGTYEVAKRLSEKIPPVKVIHSNKRLGKGRALNKALRHVHGEVVVIMDADLATDLEHLPELVLLAKEVNGVALGSRLIQGARVKRPLTRTVASIIYNKLVNLLFKTGVKDHQCGFKAFTQSVLNDVLLSMRDSWWTWDTEFIIRARRAGHPIVGIPVRWQEPKREPSLLKMAPRMVIELLKLITYLGWGKETKIEVYHKTEGR